MRPTLFLTLAALTATAQTEPRGLVGLKATHVGYSATSPRDRFNSVGLFLDLDNLGSFGVGLGLDRDQTRRVGESAVPQTHTYGQVRFNLPLGEGAGKIIFRADGLRLQRQPSVGEAVTASTAGFHVGYLSHLDPLLARLFLDAAFHRTTQTTTLKVYQWTPTLGFGVNDNYDWFTLSATRITLRESLASTPTGPLTSYKAAWKHFFLPGPLLKPASLGLSIQGGRQKYAVDPEASYIVNHGDTQKGGWLASATWKSGAWTLGLYGGASRWTSDPGQNYTTTALSTTLSLSW